MNKIDISSICDRAVTAPLEKSGQRRAAGITQGTVPCVTYVGADSCAVQPSALAPNLLRLRVGGQAELSQRLEVLGIVFGRIIALKRLKHHEIEPILAVALP